MATPAISSGTEVEAGVKGWLSLIIGWVLLMVAVVLYVWKRQRPFHRDSTLAADTGFGSL